MNLRSEMCITESKINNSCKLEHQLFRFEKIFRIIFITCVYLRRIAAPNVICLYIERENIQ